MSQKLRIGLIGTGNICKSAHIPAYAKMDDVVVSAVYDKNPAAAEAARNAYYEELKANGLEVKEGITAVCSSAEELCSMVDLVDICASLRWHAYYADLALRNGVAAMSEKPMARTWLEASQVAETARRTGGLYQLNDDNVFLPKYQVLRNVVESGLIGDVQEIRLVRGSFQVKPGRSDWFYDPVESGGGCIFDYGSHAVCASWFIIGFDKVPVNVRSIKIGLNDRTKYLNGRLVNIEVDDNALFKIRYLNPENEDWINVIIESTWTWPRTARESGSARGFVEVRGSKGTATGYVDENDEDYVLVNNYVFGEHRIKIPTVPPESVSFYDEIRNFVLCVREGKRSILDESVAENTIKIINTAQLSELKGRVALGMKEIEEYSAGFIKDGSSIWEAGDLIAVALNEPHRKRRQL